MKRIAIAINKEEEKLLKEVDNAAKDNYMSRARFTKMAWRMYLNYLKMQTRL